LIPHNIFKTKVIIEYFYCVHRYVVEETQQHYLE
jgi:hypothetical protein